MDKLVYVSVAINLFAFVQMFIDKRLAIKGRRRIPEAQLLAPVVFSGFAGVLAGMLVFRHKTVKTSFKIKLAFALLLFLALAYLVHRSL